MLKIMRSVPQESTEGEYCHSWCRELCRSLCGVAVHVGAARSGIEFDRALSILRAVTHDTAMALATGIVDKGKLLLSTIRVV